MKLFKRDPRRIASRRGATLVEMAVAAAVAALGLGSAVVVMERGESFAQSATAARLAEDHARGGLAGVFDSLCESSTALVDTSMRVKSAVALLSGQSDRFVTTGSTLRQCPSSTCPFHTRPDLSTDPVRFECGYESRSGVFGAPVVRGVVLPNNASSCPLCGTDAPVGARLDAVRFLVPRTANGALSVNGDGTPRWTGLVLIAPVATPDGDVELRRAELFISDILAAIPTYSPGFSAFTPTNPTFIDLLDFGTDGTLIATRDGSVPNTLANSDATTEAFAATVSSKGAGTYTITKTYGALGVLGVLTGTAYRTLSIEFDLLAGTTAFSITLNEGGAGTWSVAGTSNRSAKTLVRGLTEFAVSTKDSNPFDEIANPSGVADDGVVRITLGTTLQTERARNALRRHVERFVVRARNS